MVTTSFFVGEFLTSDALNEAFADAVSLSAIGTQNLASTLNIPKLIATISAQTEQMIVTGDLVCTSGSAISMPVGTTSERPNVPVFGMLRGNRDSGLIEVLLQSGKWANLLTTDAVTTPSTPPVSMVAPSFGQPTSSAIPLGWVVPQGGTGPFSYEVQYRLAGTSTWIVWAQQLTTINTTVSGLLNAARYEFQVTAINAAGTATSPIVATNTIGFLAGGPANVVASQPTSTTIAVTWLPVTGAAYQVQYAAQGANLWTDFDGPISTTSTTVSGLISNTTYNFHVVAKTIGSSLESLVAQGATTIAATVAPNATGNLQATGITPGGFTISWQPPTAGTQPLAYQVQYELVGTSAFSNYGPTTTQTSVTLTNLNSGSGYNVRVIAINSAGTSQSAPLSVTTLPGLASIGTVGGSLTSGPAFPIIDAPSVATVTSGSALAISGVTVDDPAAIYSSGTVAVVVSCTSGTVTMTDVNGNQIAGSGTATINYASTYSAVQTALASLVYTAHATGSDNIALTVTDQLVRQSSLAIPVTISSATIGGAIPDPPPGGGTPQNITSTGQPTDVNGVQAARNRSFADGLGINVRLEDPGYNGNYTISRAATIENMINYLSNGTTLLLREECNLNMNPSWMAQIAANCRNARYILYPGQYTFPANYAVVDGLMEQFNNAFGVYTGAFEGPFAADQIETQLGSINDLADAAQFQAQLYGDAHSLGLLSWQMAPISPSNNQAFGTPPADVANTSMYPPFSPNGTGAPFFTTDTNGYLADAIASAKTTTPGGLPVVISNFGWNSFPDGTTNNGLGWVNETTQASYMLITLFSAYKQGVQSYIVRELLDVPIGVSQEAVGQTYGLFNVSGVQKKSAVAFRNTTGTFADQFATSTTFSPGKLNYTVTNKPGAYGGYINTGYQDVLLQASNGTYIIVMWNEQLLNTLGGNNTPISVPPVNVTLSFAETAKSQVAVYDPILSAMVAHSTNVSTMTIPLSAYPIFVQVTF